MIILTGSQGFIGKNFLKKINDPIIEVEKDDAYSFISNFDRWNEVSLILHQGAISSTTEKNITTLITLMWHLLYFYLKKQLSMEFQ